ncbi:doxX-like family protein [Acinetobacter sp. 1294596]|uniref:DoxX-like family protein n=1 Tax=Acinetobacter TaxID=469 RepID=UPI00044FF990|nr:MULTISPECIES: DoxX-like family protein [Acinetobacter]EXF58788.1 doxX-like family protein [Acinetobacter sp. 1294596]
MRPLFTVQLTLALLWLYQGLVPKILFQSPDEIIIWQNMGFDLVLAKILLGLSGGIEMLFGLFFLKWPRSILLHSLNIIGLLLLIICIAPLQLTAAFNPVVMNIAMLMLSVVAVQLIVQEQNKDLKQ